MLLDRPISFFSGEDCENLESWQSGFVLKLFLLDILRDFFSYY